MNRRQFLHTAAAAAPAVSSVLVAQDSGRGPIRVGLSGCGSVAGVGLLPAILDLPKEWGVTVTSVFDPRDYARISTMRRLDASAPGWVLGYDSFEKMLNDPNRPLDALIIASPDHCHAAQAIAAMEKGLAVYCEVPLAHKLEDAKAMIATQRKTGKLFQAGYQRRSNPRYLQLRNAVLRDRKLLGRITRAYSQWNRGYKPAYMPKLSPKELEALKAAGYADTTEFANWRNYRKFSMGTAMSLGGYGVDAVNWLLGAWPDHVSATGDTDTYDGKEGRPLMEVPDNFNASFSYTVEGRTVRSQNSVSLDTASGGYYEKIMGIGGDAVISELDWLGNEVFRNKDDYERIAEWERAAKDGVLQVLSKDVPLTESNRQADTIDATGAPSEPVWFHALTAKAIKSPHFYHLQNFFGTLFTGGTQAGLNCPAEDAWRTLVCMAKLQQSITEKREIAITPEDYAV